MFNSKLNRIISLIKYSDVLIKDNGVFSDTKEESLDLLKKIKDLDLNKETKQNISQLIRETNIINNVAQKNIEKKIKINNLNRISLENRCIILGSYLKQFMNNSNQVDFNKIDISKAIEIPYYKEPIISAIQNWKYGNANIETDNNNIIINGITDDALSFITTRDLFENQRLLFKKLIINSKMININTLTFATIYGLNELSYGENMFKKFKYSDIFFKKLKQNEGDFKYTFLQSLFKNEIVYDYDKIKWINNQKNIEIKETNSSINLMSLIKFMLNIQINNIKQKNDSKINEIFDIIENKPFYKIKLNKLSKKEKDFIIKNLTLKKESNIRDILDTPFIKDENNELYIYKNMINFVDMSSIIGRLLEFDKVWNNQKGDNFEERIHEYTSDFFENVKKTNSVKINKSGKLELDGLISFNSKTSVLELKTLNRPTNIKDYRINIDKIYSNEYAKHCEDNFKGFKKGRFKQALDKRKDFSSKDFNTNNSKVFFVSNYIFPNEIINDSNLINYIHQFEFTTYSAYKDNKDINNIFNYYLSNTKFPRKSNKFKFTTQTDDMNEVLYNISLYKPYKNWANIYTNYRKLITYYGKNNSEIYINDIFQEVYKKLLISYFPYLKIDRIDYLAQSISKFYTFDDFDNDLFNFMYTDVKQTDLNELQSFVFDFKEITNNAIKCSILNINDNLIIKNYI